MLHNDTMLAFIEGVHFSNDPEADLEIAEEVASRQYLDLEELINTCRDCVSYRLLPEFEKYVKKTK